MKYLKIALVLLLSASGICETRMMLTAAETTSNDTEICEDEDGSKIICPHAQDEGSATAGQHALRKGDRTLMNEKPGFCKKPGF